VDVKHVLLNTFRVSWVSAVHTEEQHGAEEESERVEGKKRDPHDLMLYGFTLVVISVSKQPEKVKEESNLSYHDKQIGNPEGHHCLGTPLHFLKWCMLWAAK